MHHHVGVAERVTQGLGVADIAAAILHLRPAVGGRVERAPGDAHDPRDPVVGLEQGDQPGPESPGRSGHRDRQILLAARRRGGHSGPGHGGICGHGPTLPDTVAGARVQRYATSRCQRSWQPGRLARAMRRPRDLRSD